MAKAGAKVFEVLVRLGVIRHRPTVGGPASPTHRVPPAATATLGTDACSNDAHHAELRARVRQANAESATNLEFKSGGRP
jgi:hypothetical protein